MILILLFWLPDLTVCEKWSFSCRPNIQIDMPQGKFVNILWYFWTCEVWYYGFNFLLHLTLDPFYQSPIWEPIGNHAAPMTSRGQLLTLTYTSYISDIGTHHYLLLLLLMLLWVNLDELCCLLSGGYSQTTCGCAWCSGLYHLWCLHYVLCAILTCNIVHGSCDDQSTL